MLWQARLPVSLTSESNVEQLTWMMGSELREFFIQLSVDDQIHGEIWWNMVKYGEICIKLCIIVLELC